MPIYRETEYRLTQGLDPRCWEWTVLFRDQQIFRRGRSKSRLEAALAAQHTIDKALASPEYSRPPQQSNSGRGFNSSDHAPAIAPRA